MPQVPPLLAPPDEVLNPEGTRYNRPDKKFVSVDRGAPGHQVDLTPEISTTVTTLDTGDRDPTLTQDEAADLIRQLPRGGGESDTVGREYRVLSITANSNRYHRAGMSKVEVIEPVFPDPGIELHASIGVNGGESERLVGAGHVWDSSPRAGTGDNKLRDATIGTKITAYDDIKYLNQLYFTRSFKNRRISSIAREVFDQANASGAVDISPDRDFRISPTYNGTPGAKVLSDLARRIGGVWFVNLRDLGNTILLTDNPEINRWNIGGVVKSSVGEQAQPYTKVIVIGGLQRGARGKGKAPESGGGGSDDFEAFPGVEEGDETSDGYDAFPVESGDDGSGGGGGGGGGGDNAGKQTAGQAEHVVAEEPVRAVVGDGVRVYKYTDRTITTQFQAEVAANAILAEFERQSHTGTLEIAGDPRIQAMDTVTTPPGLGGTEYIVSEVEHTISVKEAYRTVIHASGTVDGGITPTITTSGEGGTLSPTAE